MSLQATIQARLKQANDQMRRGQRHQAVESLRDVLGMAPDLAYAHQLLSICLIDQHRLHAGLHEAREGLRLDPNDAFGHYVMGNALVAHRRLNDADDHLRIALGLEPENVAFLHAMIHLHHLRKEYAAASELLERAKSADPEDADTWNQLAANLQLRGQFDQAMLMVDKALSLEPQHISALVTKGELLLHRKDSRAALEHCHWALRLDPEDREALQLLSAIKARSNPILGLWWRFNSLFSGRSTAVVIIMLLSFYMFYRIADLALADFDLEQWRFALSMVWLGFCAYTWVGPGLFQRMVSKELKQVDLKPDY